MDNKVKGYVSLTLDEKTFTLCYDYNAIALVEEKFDRKDLARIDTMKVADLAYLLKCGLLANHKEIEQYEIKDVLSLMDGTLIVDIQTAIDRAFLYAFYGDKTAKKIIDELEIAKKKAVDSVDGETKKSKKQ